MSHRLPDTLSMIRALIERPSISSTDSRFDQSNLAVIHLLADWFDTLGFQVEIKPVSDRKANLIATLGDARNPNGLVLSGHTDTVPFDAGQWSTDPFTLTERDDRLFGLGTADMKSFFALVLQAVQHFSSNDLAQPLVILATADEESSMLGAKALLQERIRLGRYAVIGEPTQLRPVRMHKGVMMESIRITGHAGHSSDPSLGASALEGMLSVLTEIIAWREELQARYHNPLFKVAVPTLNLGAIHGGDSPNRICSLCQTSFDLRPLPGMSLDELKHALQQRLAPVLADKPGLAMEIRPLFEGLPAFETPAEAEIIKTCEHFTGHAAQAVAFGTEAPYLSELGMETVVLGPGSIDQAHQPDEYLALNQIQPTIDLVGELIERYCVTEDRRQRTENR